MEEVTMKTSPLESTWINYTYPDAPSMVYYLHFTEMHGKLVGKYSRPNEACGKKTNAECPDVKIEDWFMGIGSPSYNSKRPTYRKYACCNPESQTHRIHV